MEHFLDDEPIDIDEENADWRLKTVCFARTVSLRNGGNESFKSENSLFFADKPLQVAHPILKIRLKKS